MYSSCQHYSQSAIKKMKCDVYKAKTFDWIGASCRSVFRSFYSNVYEALCNVPIYLKVEPAVNVVGCPGPSLGLSMEIELVQARIHKGSCPSCPFRHGKCFSFRTPQLMFSSPSAAAFSDVSRCTRAPALCSRFKPKVNEGR